MRRPWLPSLGALSLTTTPGFENAPPREAGQQVKDEGDGGAKIADYLASKKLI